MHFQTFSVVVGSRACNAHCPFCISKQTGLPELTDVNWRNFQVACKLFSSQDEATTVLLTGKGEPTLYPELITKYLMELKGYQFPLIELQTNGIRIASGELDEYLQSWYEQGMTTIALSVVHYDSRKNAEIYQPEKADFTDLEKLINKLHAPERKFSVRLCVMLLKGYIDCPLKVAEMVVECKRLGVEQLTFRNIKAADVTSDDKVTEWTRQHALSDNEVELINQYIQNYGTRLCPLMHDAVIYDVGGQNVCLGTCLTYDPYQEDFRQLIFFPSGELRWDWQYKGARIL
jgi:molybdenum cofactor biosynthesis enzyme MoaA